MSVQYEPKLTVGWRVEQDDIPDFEDRWNDEWLELCDLAHKASKLLGKHAYVEDLCDEEDSWCGDTQMVGVPMYDSEIEMDEGGDKLNRLGEFAKDVYRQVMRKEPEDGPYLISWIKVS